jgi:hypothetical protein
MKRAKPFTLAVFGAAALSTSWTPAVAQASCGERREIVTSLEQRFEETPVGIGLMQPGRVLELLVSESGSWTLLVTMPNGRSCIISAGEHWEGSTIPVKGDPI